MTCSAVAEPGADFIWIKDNKTLEPSDDVQIFTSDHHSSLQLYIYDDSVFGDYECRATNMLGTMARVIVLEQATKPAAPTFKIKVSSAETIRNPSRHHRADNNGATAQRVLLLPIQTTTTTTTTHSYDF